MLKMLKKKCTAETTGIITKKKWNGDLWFLTVEYIVDGKKYRRKEQLTYHVTRKHSVGRVTVGFHANAAIENFAIGAEVKVRYDPNKPKRSYLPENDGYHLS